VRGVVSGVRDVLRSFGLDCYLRRNARVRTALRADSLFFGLGPAFAGVDCSFTLARMTKLGVGFMLVSPAVPEWVRSLFVFVGHFSARGGVPIYRDEGLASGRAAAKFNF
jgi:hypothetical protein